MAASRLHRLERLPRRDVPRAVELILDGVGAYYSSTALLRHAKARSVSSRASKFIVLRSENRLIGLLMYRIEKSLCLVYEIHVDRDHRCGGEGQRLMDDLASLMSGFVLILFVHRANRRAIEFYGRNGFEMDESYESPVHYRMFRFN